MAQLPPKKTKRPFPLRGASQKSLKAKSGSTSRRPISVRKKATPVIAPQMEAASKKDIEAEIVRLHNRLQGVYRFNRDVVRQIISDGCAVAACFEGNESAWKAFCEDEIWSGRPRGPKPDRSGQALRFVLLRITGLNAAKLASKWYKAVQPLVAKGVEPKDMPAAIEDGGGIERLAREHAKRKKFKLSKRGLTKNPARAAAKTARGEEVQRGKRTSVNIHASLEKDGARVFGLPMGSYASLKVHMQGREGPDLEIAILDARQIDYPE
ncbi:MAG: hypothetical protein ACR65X_08950 [Methylocystis sp.]